MPTEKAKTEIKARSLSLLDHLMFKMGCNYLSDLKFLTRQQQLLLEWEVEQVKPELTDLEDWHRTLHYLTELENRYETSAQVKQALLDWLNDSRRGEEEKGPYQAAVSK